MNLRLPPFAVAALAVAGVALVLPFAAPSVVAVARAAPDTPDAGAPPRPRFDAEPFSEVKTPSPTSAEWKPVDPVAVTSKLPEGCNAYRLREWVRIRCSKLATSTLALLGGTREGVSLFLDPGPNGSPAPPGGEVLFPVRRGDRRVVEWSTFGEAYEGFGFPEVAFLISESWPPGDPGPTLIVH